MATRARVVQMEQPAESNGNGLLPLGKTRATSSDCRVGLRIVNLTLAPPPGTGVLFASTSCTVTVCCPGVSPLKSCDVDAVMMGSWLSSCTRKLGEPAGAIVGLVI